VVKNLIDFSACDVPDVPEDRSSDGQCRLEEELMLISEVEHLWQMLVDANEENHIQVAMVRDEVVEKQQHVEELKRQCHDIDGKLQTAVEQVSKLEARAAQFANERDEARTLAESRRVEAKLARIESEHLLAEVERLQTELTASKEKSVQVNKSSAETALAKGATPIEEGAQAHIAEPTITIAELCELCLRTREVLSGCGPPKGQAPSSRGAGRLEADLQRLHDIIVAVHVEAECANTDRRKLEAKLREQKKLQSVVVPTAKPAVIPTAKPILAPPLTKFRIPNEPPLQWCTPSTTKEMHAVNRNAAQATKQIRYNTEHQFAWRNAQVRIPVQ